MDALRDEREPAIATLGRVDRSDVTEGEEKTSEAGDYAVELQELHVAELREYDPIKFEVHLKMDIRDWVDFRQLVPSAGRDRRRSRVQSVRQKRPKERDREGGKSLLAGYEFWTYQGDKAILPRKWLRLARICFGRAFMKQWNRRKFLKSIVLGRWFDSEGFFFVTYGDDIVASCIAEVVLRDDYGAGVNEGGGEGDKGGAAAARNVQESSAGEVGSSLGDGSPLSPGGGDDDDDAESEIANSFRSRSPHSQNRENKLMEEVSSKHFGRIKWLMVHPRHRRKGVGRELLRKCLDFFRRQGIRNIYASMACGRAEAIHLLKSEDFNFGPDPESEAEVHYWSRSLWKVYIGYTDRACAEEEANAELKGARCDDDLPGQKRNEVSRTALPLSAESSYRTLDTSSAAASTSTTDLDVDIGLRRRRKGKDVLTAMRRFSRTGNRRAGAGGESLFEGSGRPLVASFASAGSRTGSWKSDSTSDRPVSLKIRRRQNLVVDTGSSHNSGRDSNEGSTSGFLDSPAYAPRYRDGKGGTEGSTADKTDSVFLSLDSHSLSRHSLDSHSLTRRHSAFAASAASHTFGLASAFGEDQEHTARRGSAAARLQIRAQRSPPGVGGGRRLKK